ncbi:MAG: hypothetical protein ACO2ON_03770 [Candidatus Nanopusillus sp.]
MDETQTQQQNTNIDQSNKKGILIDYETLNKIHNVIDANGFLLLLMVPLALIGMAASYKSESTIIFFIILVLSIIGAIISIYTSNLIYKLKPKRVKKIIKTIITYLDGTVVEKETKYEYQ